MRAGVKVDGLDRLAIASRLVGERAAAAVDRAVAATAAAVQGRYVALVQRGGRSGRVYKLYAPRRVHQASAPGEPPKTDRGQLAGSAAIVHAQGSRAAEVVVSAPYAAALEFGSPRTGLLPRPALGPALKAEQPSMRARFTAALNEVLREGGR